MQGKRVKGKREIGSTPPVDVTEKDIVQDEITQSEPSDDTTHGCTKPFDAIKPQGAQVAGQEQEDESKQAEDKGESEQSQAEKIKLAIEAALAAEDINKPRVDTRKVKKREFFDFEKELGEQGEYADQVGETGETVEHGNEPEGEIDDGPEILLDYFTQNKKKEDDIPKDFIVPPLDEEIMGSKAGENKKIKPTKAEQKKAMPKKVALGILLGIVLIGLYLFARFMSAANSAYEPSVPVVSGGEPWKAVRERAVQTDPGMVRRDDTHIFIVGATDSEGYRTDAMLLVFFEPSADKLNVLQVPRDLFIEAGNASNKANTLNAYGGGELMKSAMSSAFGIPIDNYVVVSIDVFKQLVDEIGGVEIEVPFDMDYEDPYQDLYIHLDKGLQVLNGEQAEGFVRYRFGYVNMDFGRMNAQKMFLAAAAKELIEPANMLKVPGLIDIVFKNMKTDLTAGEMLSHATSALTVPLENIRIFTTPSESWYYDGESGLTVYKDEIMYIINNYFSPYDELITNATIVEYGRDFNSEFNLDGDSLVDIDEERPLFYLDPKWNWEEYLAAQKGETTVEPEQEQEDTGIDTTPNSDVGDLPNTEG